jgi:hypothetical protein
MRIIKVKQEHINAGCRHHSENCPIAIAIKEALPGYSAAVMSIETTIGIVEGEYEPLLGAIANVRNREVFVNSVEMKKFISAFDYIGSTTLKAEPFEFDLDQLEKVPIYELKEVTDKVLLETIKNKQKTLDEIVQKIKEN